MLALGTFVNTVGNGMFMTVAALFFTRSVGLSVAQVGLGLTLAGLVNLVASAPLGHLADRAGPRELTVAFTVLSGLASAALVLVGSFGWFVAVVCLVGVADAGSQAARGAVIAGALGPEGRVRGRAYLRAVTNVGISLGTLPAGLALAADTRSAYVAVILGDALTYLAAAGIARRLPHLPPVPAPTTGPRLVALRDRPYLAVTALNGLLAVHYGLLEIAVPLWVAARTEAPRWVVAVLFVINTTAVVLFQVRASRGTEDLGAAAVAQRRSGVLIAAACVLYALSGGRSAWVAVAVLITAAAVHTAGELLQAAGSWGLGFGLAPAHAQGQYQGVFSMGFSLSQMLTPVLVTALAVQWGTPGWLLLAGVFVLAGAAMPPVARWAARNRPPASGSVAGSG